MVGRHALMRRDDVVDTSESQAASSRASAFPKILALSLSVETLNELFLISGGPWISHSSYATLSQTRMSFNVALQ